MVNCIAPDLPADLTSGRDDAGLFQRAICSVLIDGLEPTRRYPNTNELLDLGYPDAVLVQVGVKFAPHIFSHVPPNATFFLRHTTAMNDAATRDPRPGNTANLRHRRKGRAIDSITRIRMGA